MKKFRKNTGAGFVPLGDILAKFDPLAAKYISREFQDYGYRLAEELNDLEHKALYIKLAKTLPRPILEQTRNFVKDASNVRNRARLFMWKLSDFGKTNPQGKRDILKKDA